MLYLEWEKKKEIVNFSIEVEAAALGKAYMLGRVYEDT